MAKRKTAFGDIKEMVETVPKSLLNRLRRIVQPPGKKGTWLRHLSDAQLAELYFRLKAGQAAYALAKICQDQWGIMIQSQPQSLARSIRSFKDKALGDLQLAKLGGGGSSENKQVVKVLDKKAKNLVEKCDGLSVLAWTVLSQQERVALMMEKENEYGFMSKETDNAIKVLSDVTTQYMKLQTELGIFPDTPRSGDLHLHAHLKGMLGTLDDVQREKMADVATRFVDIIKKKAITLKQDKDGSFKYLKAAESGGEDAECVPVEGD